MMRAAADVKFSLPTIGFVLSPSLLLKGCIDSRIFKLLSTRNAHTKTSTHTLAKTTLGVLVSTHSSFLPSVFPQLLQSSINNDQEHMMTLPLLVMMMTSCALVVLLTGLLSKGVSFPYYAVVTSTLS